MWRDWLAAWGSRYPNRRGWPVRLVLAGGPCGASQRRVPTSHRQGHFINGNTRCQARNRGVGGTAILMDSSPVEVTPDTGCPRFFSLSFTSMATMFSSGGLRYETPLTSEVWNGYTGVVLCRDALMRPRMLSGHSSRAWMRFSAHLRRSSSRSAPQCGQSRSPNRILVPQLAQPLISARLFRTLWIFSSVAIPQTALGTLVPEIFIRMA